MDEVRRTRFSVVAESRCKLLQKEAEPAQC